MTFKHITLALDLSLSSPGFAVLALSDDSPIILEKSFVKTKAKQSHGFRLTEIKAELLRYFLVYSPKYVVREKSFSRFAASTQAIYKVNGVADVVAQEYGYDIAEIATTSVKKAVTGSGKASKYEVADAVFRILQIENTVDFYTDKGALIDDLTDAAAVGIAFYKERGFIEI